LWAKITLTIRTILVLSIMTDKLLVVGAAGLKVEAELEYGGATTAVSKGGFL
jgi:hypothetical protein